MPMGKSSPHDFAYEAGHLASDAGFAGNPVNIGGWAPISVCLPLRLLLFVANILLSSSRFQLKLAKNCLIMQVQSMIAFMGCEQSSQVEM